MKISILCLLAFSFVPYGFASTDIARSDCEQSLIVSSSKVQNAPVLFQKLYYAIYGKWELIGKDNLLQTPKAVVIAAPHTSNHDALAILAIRTEHKIPIYFLIKHEWTRVPLIGRIFKRFGAIGVNREEGGGNVISQWAEIFNQSKELKIGITPEGTRKYVPHWKSGFYRIAVDANVPVILAVIDPNFSIRQRAHRLIISGPMQMTGNRKLDMDAIRAEYKRISDEYHVNGGGFYPELAGPVRLRGE